MKKQNGFFFKTALIFSLAALSLSLTAQQKTQPPKKLRPSEEIQLLKQEQEKLQKELEEKKAQEEARQLEMEELSRRAEEAEKALKDKADAEAQKIQTGFIDSMFFTLQFGGGSMLTGGAGLSFFNNVVRPEVLFGYTPSGAYKDVSIITKLNARIFGVSLAEEIGFFATVGASFTFFSGNAQIASAAFLAQEFDFKNVGFMSTFTFYLEQNFFFLKHSEGNLLFQLAAGIRISIFEGGML